MLLEIGFFYSQRLFFFNLISQIHPGTSHMGEFVREGFHNRYKILLELRRHSNSSAHSEMVGDERLLASMTVNTHTKLSESVKESQAVEKNSFIIIIAHNTEN